MTTDSKLGVAKALRWRKLAYASAPATGQFSTELSGSACPANVTPALRSASDRTPVNLLYWLYHDAGDPNGEIPKENPLLCVRWLESISARNE